jgi:hypothetical protein
VPQTLCSRGVTYHNLTPVQKRQFLRVVKPVYTKYQKDEQVAGFISQIQKLKAQPSFRTGAPTDNPPANCLS